MLHRAPICASNNLLISKLNSARAFGWVCSKPTLEASTCLHKKANSKICNKYVRFVAIVFWWIIHRPPTFNQNWRGLSTKKSDSYIQINKFLIKISYMPASAEICPHFNAFRYKICRKIFLEQSKYYDISSIIIDKFDSKNPIDEFS